MRNGKKISASSLLTILGVVCFMTVLVAAFAITASFTVNQSVTTTPKITITEPTAPGAIYAGTQATYSFTATPNMAVTDVIITVTVTESGDGYTLDDVDADTVVVYIDLTPYSVVLDTTVTNGMSGDVVGPVSLTAAAHTGSVVLTYNVIGSYSVLVEFDATAPDP